MSTRVDPERLDDSNLALPRVGEWLTARMALRGISRRQLAMRSGLNPSSISRILTGKSHPSWATLCHLLSALGDDPQRLLSSSASPTLGLASMPTRQVEDALRRDPLLVSSDVALIMRQYRDLRRARMRLARVEESGARRTG